MFPGWYMMISTSYFKVFNVFIYFGVAIYDVLVYIILVMTESFQEIRPETLVSEQMPKIGYVAWEASKQC